MQTKRYYSIYTTYYISEKEGNTYLSKKKHEPNSKTLHYLPQKTCRNIYLDNIYYDMDY